MVQNISNEKRKKVSLSSVFATAINLPRYCASNGDFPLYPHAEGSKVQLKRPENWHKQANSTFNSPSNARVVCLCKDGANVLYWAAPIKGGKSILNKEFASPYVFDSDKKAGIKQVLNPLAYSWETAGFQCLVNPVVLCNLEELWVDADLFATPAYENYHNMFTRLQPGKPVLVDFVLSILEQEISTPSKQRTVKDTFPLLRSIVIVNTAHAQRITSIVDFHKCAIRTGKVKAIIEAEASGQRRVVGESSAALTHISQQTGFAFAVCPIPTGSILKFSLGDYKFDALYLTSLRNAILNKYGDKPIAKATMQADVQTNASAEDKPNGIAEQIYGIIVKRLTEEGYTGFSKLPSGKVNTNEKEQSETLSFALSNTKGEGFEVDFSVKSGDYALRHGRSGIQGCVPKNKTEPAAYADFMVFKIMKFCSGGKDGESVGGDETLEGAIARMEEAGFDEKAIKTALWAHKQANSDYFRQQVPLLSAEKRSKYAAVFHN